MFMRALARDSRLKYRRHTLHSSCRSANMAPTSRITDARLGKMPTTSVRRLTSRWRRSNGLWDQILSQGALGKEAKARIVVSGACEHLRRLRKTQGEPFGHRLALGIYAPPIGLGEDGAHRWSHKVSGGLGNLAKQVSYEVDAAALPAGPRPAGGDGVPQAGMGVGEDQGNPQSPRARSPLKKAVHPAPSSVVTRSTPSPSRPPSALTAMAMTRDTLTALPPSRTLWVSASSQR